MDDFIDDEGPLMDCDTEAFEDWNDEGPWVDPDFGPEPDHPDDAAWDAQWGE